MKKKDALGKPTDLDCYHICKIIPRSQLKKMVSRSHYKEKTSGVKRLISLGLLPNSHKNVVL